MVQDQTKYNLLYITSLPPTHSAGLVQAKIDALMSRGHNVDCMTIYDYDGKKDNIITLLPKPEQLQPSMLRRLVILPIKRIVCFVGIYKLLKMIKDWGMERLTGAGKKKVTFYFCIQMKKIHQYNRN